MNTKQSLNHRPDEELPDGEAKARFATAIGSLMYLTVGTRSDIAFALGLLSRFTSQPQSYHQVALQRLLRYIKATQSRPITYRNGQLIGYTDADFGGSIVTDGAYSTSGYVFQTYRFASFLVVQETGGSSHVYDTCRINRTIQCHSASVVAPHLPS
jgi:hypothetical protein